MIPAAGRVREPVVLAAVIPGGWLSSCQLRVACIWGLY
jgi:hypothetical protein